MEAIHEYREALVKLAPPSLGLIHPEVDARIDIEQEAAQPCLPFRPVVALEEVAQRGSLRAEASPRQGAAAQPLPQGLSRSRGSKLWRDGQKMNPTVERCCVECRLPPTGTASRREVAPS